jgi:exonuclease SbcC
LKLARLVLEAFGPFTDKTIDFASTPGHVHLIYGPNEAGKSAALRAITDLRFGIPVRSTDDFLHPSAQLRIRGVFFDQHGGQTGLVRRKGRKQTLSSFNVANGSVHEGLPVSPEIERALTAGLERADFENMFGLDHPRLREGGRLLLNGDGELGSALFEASAGTSGIGAVLDQLDADAKAVFNPRGQALHATINKARRELDAQRQLWKEAQTRPADWQTLHRAHETAKAALEEINRKLETARRHEHELTELRTVEPLLRDCDLAAVELNALSDAPDLPENARETRLAAEHTARHAAQELDEAQSDIERCAAALDGLTIEVALIEHSAAIERIAAGVESARRSRIEAQQLQASIEHIEANLEELAARIAPVETRKAILKAVPSVADRVALDRHLDSISRLRERLDGDQKHLQTLDQQATTDEYEAATLPDPELRRAVVKAIRQGQSMGDVARKKSALNGQIRELDRKVALASSELGVGSLQALRKARPLLEPQIRSNEVAASAIAEDIGRCRAEALTQKTDLDVQQLRRSGLAAEGEVVTAETLRHSRERRDQGWALIRGAYIERTADPEESGKGFDSERPLPDAFEHAQTEADRHADMLRADAKRAAVFEECTTRIAQMEARRSEIAGDLADLAARDEQRRAVWAQQLANAILPLLDPAALREWQAARRSTLDLAERLAVLEAERSQVESDAGDASAALVAALKAVDSTPGLAPRTMNANTLASLIEEAAAWEKTAAESEAQAKAQARTTKRRQSEQDTCRAAIAATQAELADDIAAVGAWHARLFLPAGSAPEVVKARLQELDNLARRAAEATETRESKARQQAVVDDLTQQAADLAALLREPPAALVDDFAERLCKRLHASREQEHQRVTLTKERARAEDRKSRAQAEQARALATLADLCSAAGATESTLLAEIETRAARKRQARDAVTTLRQQLTKASARPESELRASLAGRDALTLESERERCRAHIAERDAGQATARNAEEHARRALEAIDASDRAAIAREAMESSAARYRAAIRPWARLRLAHALLQEALRRFRERAQAPMVANASTYFELITGGRFRRLVADEADGKPVLCAEREDGTRIGVDAMSEGTADQLYLALRLAALDLQRIPDAPMPLVLDDVLVTSDDARAANILKALGRFGEGTQVMLFTHHRHLIEVARAALTNGELAVHEL